MSGTPSNIVEVAVPCPVPQVFSYLTASEKIEAGTRVKVPFGPRKLIGVVTTSLGPNDRDWPSAELRKKLRPIVECIDEAPILSDCLLRLGFWISQYYCHPIGEVFKTMLPASSSSRQTSKWSLTDEGCKAIVDKKSPEFGLLTYLFLNKTTLSQPTIQKRLKAAASLGICPNTKTTLESLHKAKLLYKENDKEIDVRRCHLDKGLVKSPASPQREARPTPNADQASALNLLSQEIQKSSSQTHPPSTVLLWGVTGSGKTEVYLQHIHKLFSSRSGAQVLVLVPEISLTPQMTAVFSARFPGQVGVAHSNLSTLQRWKVWEAVRSGSVSILISPRSGVFAPFHDLKLVIVDEEHDSSYKQNSHLQYHGRDLAVLRAKLEGAQCILGSATPSLESYNNALNGRYTLIRLAKRAKGTALPLVSLVSPPKTQKGSAILSRPGDTDLGPVISDAFEPIASEVVEALNENLQQGRQAIVLVNRRGYSDFLLDIDKKESVLCKSCSISLTLHRKDMTLKCHYCGHVMTLRSLQSQNPKTKYFAIGYGSQKAEEFLSSKLPNARISRLDSDIASNRKHLTQTLDDFRSGKQDILLGTQMLAKGHDFPNVALTIILDCDKMLNLPDFRAGERTFQLLVQAAGRSGRQSTRGSVIVQSIEHDHPVIQAGIEHDYEKFASLELSIRNSHGYPPFSRQILWEFSCLKKTILDKYINQLEKHLVTLSGSLSSNQPDLFAKMKILGPMPPSIERIMARYRMVVLFTCSDDKALHQVHAVMLKEIPRPPADIRLNVDVDPQSLL